MSRHVEDVDRHRLSDPTVLAEVQGWFNILGGAWPLVSMRTFEMVFGPKTDRWLEYTVAGLLVTNGVCQVSAARQGETDNARRLGRGTALTLLAVDLVFVPAGRIRWTYLLDAALEVGWLGLWARARR
jgi:hypothetical protein